MVLKDPHRRSPSQVLLEHDLPDSPPKMTIRVSIYISRAGARRLHMHVHAHVQHVHAHVTCTCYM